MIQGEYISGEDKGGKFEGGGCGSDPVFIEGNFKSSGYWGMILYEPLEPATCSKISVI